VRFLRNLVGAFDDSDIRAGIGLPKSPEDPFERSPGF
jgi:hypothetical protein